MGETPHRAPGGGAKSLVRDSATPGAIPSGSFLSVSSAPSAVRSTPSGRRRLVAVTRPSLPRIGRDAFHRVLLLNTGTWWNRSLPNPSPALATEDLLGRDVPAPIQTRNYFGGADVSSPWHPLATQNFLGRDVPAPIPTRNYFGGGDVPSPWPPSHPKLPGTRRPSPNPDPQLPRSLSSVRDFPCPSPTRLQNPERVSDSSRG